MEPILVAKMYCSEISHMHAQQAYDGAPKIEQEKVRLNAVYGQGGEANKAWAKSTPSGSLELTINNPDAFGVLKPGYYKVQLVPCGVDD